MEPRWETPQQGGAMVRSSLQPPATHQLDDAQQANEPECCQRGAIDGQESHDDDEKVEDVERVREVPPGVRALRQHLDGQLGQEHADDDLVQRGRGPGHSGRALWVAVDTDEHARQQHRQQHRGLEARGVTQRDEAAGDRDVAGHAAQPPVASALATLALLAAQRATTSERATRPGHRA